MMEERHTGHMLVWIVLDLEEVRKKDSTSDEQPFHRSPPVMIFAYTRRRRRKRGRRRRRRRKKRRKRRMRRRQPKMAMERAKEGKGEQECKNTKSMRTKAS